MKSSSFLWVSFLNWLQVAIKGLVALDTELNFGQRAEFQKIYRNREMLFEFVFDFDFS